MNQPAGAGRGHYTPTPYDATQVRIVFTQATLPAGQQAEGRDILFSTPQRVPLAESGGRPGGTQRNDNVRQYPGTGLLTDHNVRKKPVRLYCAPSWKRDVMVVGIATRPEYSWVQKNGSYVLCLKNALTGDSGLAFCGNETFTDILLPRITPPKLELARAMLRRSLDAIVRL